MPKQLLGRLELGGRTSTITLYPGPAFGGPTPRSDGAPNLLICDENTAPLAPPSQKGLFRVTVPAGERCKQPDVFTSVLESCMAAGLTRSSTIYGVGGGAVTDLTAFVGSVYLRGIRVVLIPTTLLAMVDAAVGGKTGIDLGGYKNMVGTFYPAAEVRIVPEFLRTLPQREYLSGLAEVLKAAFLGDSELVDLLEDNVHAVLNRDEGLLQELIRRAVQVKIAVVQSDFTEQGDRAFLNLGHTFGHALESVLGLGSWTHGEAVAWGIARAMHAGTAAGITDAAWSDRVITLLQRYGYETEPVPVDPEAVLSAMEKDKKRAAQGVRFVLQRNCGQNLLHTMESAQITDILTI